MTEPRPCETCQGEGRVPIGENFVTREMALDAGEPAMEGMSVGLEYGTCHACNGTGRTGDKKDPFDILEEAGTALRLFQDHHNVDSTTWMKRIGAQIDLAVITWREERRVKGEVIKELRGESMGTIPFMDEWAQRLEKRGDE